MTRVGQKRGDRAPISIPHCRIYLQLILQALQSFIFILESIGCRHYPEQVVTLSELLIQFPVCLQYGFRDMNSCPPKFYRTIARLPLAGIQYAKSRDDCFPMKSSEMSNHNLQRAIGSFRNAKQGARSNRDDGAGTVERNFSTRIAVGMDPASRGDLPERIK